MRQARPDPDAILLIELCLPALGATTRLILDQVVSAIRSRCPNVKDTVQIVLGEVLNNIVEHGYERGTCGAVVVRLERAGRILSLDIRDWGQAYPDRDLPEGVAPKPADLAEGGYGWFLIRTLSQSVTYHRHRQCNHLSLSLTA